MNTYFAETDQIGISETGIHLLRSGFNYDTIDFAQLESVTIERGRELNNWLVVFVVGLALLFFSIYYSLGIFGVIHAGEVSVVYIEEIIVPIIPLLLGGYCVYSSTRNGIVLKLKTLDNKLNSFPLKRIQEQGKLREVQNFLREKLSTRLQENI